METSQTHNLHINSIINNLTNLKNLINTPFLRLKFGLLEFEKLTIDNDNLIQNTLNISKLLHNNESNLELTSSVFSLIDYQIEILIKEIASIKESIDANIKFANENLIKSRLKYLLTGISTFVEKSTLLVTDLGIALTEMKDEKDKKKDILNELKDISKKYKELKTENQLLNVENLNLTADKDSALALNKVITTLKDNAESSKEEYQNQLKEISENLDLTIVENDILKEEKNLLISEKSEIQSKLLLLENSPITAVYATASDKYSNLHAQFRKYFYWSIVGIISSILLSIIFKSYIVEFIFISDKNTTSNLVELWILKISVMLLGVTLASYFLKQSSHYQRLADQHHQTEVELNAYPNFMNSVPPEQAIDIRKELALKYFGKEIDSTPHKDISNLMSEQIKSTTEMVKATTDAIKNLKGSD